MEKEEEYSVKKRQLTFLEKKEYRIQLKKAALMKYEKFLDRVRENSDEFNEVSDIIHRYETLIKENKKMDQTHKDLEDKLKEIKDSTTNYIKQKSDEIMKLNNQIAAKKTDYEQIIDEQNALKAEAEEISSKKLGRVSELA